KLRISGKTRLALTPIGPIPYKSPPRAGGTALLPIQVRVLHARVYAGRCSGRFRCPCNKWPISFWSTADKLVRPAGGGRNAAAAAGRSARNGGSFTHGERRDQYQRL